MVEGDPIIHVVTRKHRMKKMNPFPRLNESEFEFVDTVISLKKIIPKEVKGELIFPELNFNLQEYPNLPPVDDPQPDFYKQAVFDNNPFLIIDNPDSSVQKKEEILKELEHRKKRAWERKVGPALEKRLGITIMKDNVHHLVDFFEEYLITHVNTKFFKQYVV